METASYIWIEYLRLNIAPFWFIGLMFVMYRIRDLWRDYRHAQQIPRDRGFLDPNPEYWLKAPRATIRLVWPIWKYMLLTGIPLTMIDFALGPK